MRSCNVRDSWIVRGLFLLHLGPCSNPVLHFALPPRFRIVISDAALPLLTRSVKIPPVTLLFSTLMCYYLNPLLRFVGIRRSRGSKFIFSHLCSHLLFQTVNNQSKAKGPREYFIRVSSIGGFGQISPYQIFISTPAVVSSRIQEILGDATRGRILSFRIRASESSFQPQLRAFA